MFSIDGIASGFDTTSIIESLLGFQQTQINTFNSRKAEIATEQSAFKGIEAQLINFQSALSRLNRSTNSVFDVMNATSSDEDVIVAAAGSKAQPGTYNLTVSSLATAEQIGSQGFASDSTEIGLGEITFQVGDRPATTITIDESNNTLSGMAAAINEQSDDVNAGIIFDQGADAYRILISSKHTGSENSISVVGDFKSGGLVPDFTGAPIQEATDAVVTIGSGAGAITATYSTNQVEGLINDVTLDLQSAEPGKTISIKVAQDNSSAVEAMETFVNEFNSIMSYIDDQTRYNPDTDRANPLNGNRSASKIQNKLRDMVVSAVPGLATGNNRLAAIGLDIDLKGKMTLDSAKLDKALSGKLEGVDPDGIRNLFGLNGSSTNAAIEFLTGTKRTAALDIPYEVNITRAAEQANVTATDSLAASIDITSDNNTFQITLNGTVSETLTLSEGTYTQEELAAEFENVINSSTELSQNDVEVTLNERGNLEVTSERYGSKSTISSVSGAASTALGFSGTESATGYDVEGEFIVNGVVETATGRGRVLTGDLDNEFTADLQLRVTLAPSSVTAGNEAEVLVTRGVSGQLALYLEDLFDSETGAFRTINEEFESRLESIDKSIKQVEEITAAKRDYLIAEFTALESIISELQTTGNFLSTQLASLQSNK